MLKKIQNHEETVNMLMVYSSAQENILRNICKANQNKRMFKIINDWLNQITKVPLERIRDML
jgi:hypothetical protein